MRALFNSFGAFIGTAMNAMRPGSYQGTTWAQTATSQPTTPGNRGGFGDTTAAAKRAEGGAATLYAGSTTDKISGKKTLLGGS